jgi:hypothetical protein
MKLPKFGIDTGTIVVYVFQFLCFLDSTWEDKMFWTER